MIAKAAGELSNVRHDFTAIMASGTELTDARIEAFCESWGDDGAAGSLAGVVWVTLHRKDESPEQAIRSGISNLQSADCRVVRAEIEPACLATAAASKQTRRDSCITTAF